MLEYALYLRIPTLIFVLIVEYFSGISISLKV